MPNEAQGTPASPAKPATSILGDVMQTLNGDAPGQKAVGDTTPGAPAIIGRPVYEKDLDQVKFLGVSKLKDIFGQVVNEQQDEQALPLNFGSKRSTGALDNEVRLRLMNLKKLISSWQMQAAAAFRGQHVNASMMETLPIYKEHLKPLFKAYNITDFSNWMPTVWARFYFEEYELPYLLADLFDYVPMDSATMEVPGDTGHLEGTEETDAAVFDSQSTVQAKYTVHARNNVVHTKITQDMMADSAPAYLDKLRRDLMKGTIRSYEKALLNGSTKQTSVRGDLHPDTDIRALTIKQTFSKAFDGLRQKAFDNETLLGGGQIVYDHGGDTASKLMFEKLLNMMGPMASEKDDLCYILPSAVENQLVTGAIPELFTAFAFGGLASNVTGQVPPVFGVRPVTSQYARDDLDAAGVYNAAGVFTNVLLVKKSRFLNYMRQATRMWAAPSLPSSDELLMTSKTRHSWNGNPQNAKEKAVVMAVNVAKA